MKIVTFQMDELTCPSCVNKIEKVLSKENGVHEVKVLFNSQKVKISYNEDIGTPAKYLAVLMKLGYSVDSQGHFIA